MTIPEALNELEVTFADGMPDKHARCRLAYAVVREWLLETRGFDAVLELLKAMRRYVVEDDPESFRRKIRLLREESTPN